MFFYEIPLCWENKREVRVSLPTESVACDSPLLLFLVAFMPLHFLLLGNIVVIDYCVFNLCGCECHEIISKYRWPAIFGKLTLLFYHVASCRITWTSLPTRVLYKIGTKKSIQSIPFWKSVQEYFSTLWK